MVDVGIRNIQPVKKAKKGTYYYIKELKERNNKKILENKRALYEIFNEHKSDIKSRTINFSEKDNKLIMKVSYKVNKDIASKQKIQVKY